MGLWHPRRWDFNFTKLALATFGLILLMNRTCLGKVLMTKEEALQRACGPSVRREEHRMSLTEEAQGRLKARLGYELQVSEVSFFTCRDDDGLKGFIFFIEKPGKEGPISLFVAIRPNGAVFDVGLLESSETKGERIKRRIFLGQFIGRSGRDPVRLQKDIDGITGATISSKAVAEAVREALAIWEEVF